MRKVLVAIFGAMILIMASGARAQAQQQAPDWEKEAAASQLMITASEDFWGNDDHSGFAKGVLMLDLSTGYAVTFGYVGAKLALGDDLDLYMLGVTTNDPFGWWVGPSLWADYQKGKHDFFIEGEYYCPYKTTSRDPDAPSLDHQYYGFSEYMYGDQTGLGLALEVMGNEDDDHPFELAYGPVFRFKKIKLWAAYDETPLEHPVFGDDNNKWLLRLQVNF